MRFFGGLSVQEIGERIGRLSKDSKARLGDSAILVKINLGVMTGEQWESVRRLLDEALDNPENRPALLAELRTSDPEVCDELERLIDEVEPEDGTDSEAASLASEFVGQVIGPYTIVREIGRGGAGIVFLAVREEAGVRVEVALKFLQRDFLRGTPRRTFQRELRVLARLNHSNIARLLDWGTIPGGLFYLALEYVDGQPITRYGAGKSP